MTGSLTWLGTATVLLRWGGLTLLTDPDLLHRGQHAHLGKGLVSRRPTEPALQVDQLPPLDGVVLSHLHGDHFDRGGTRLVAVTGERVRVTATPGPHARDVSSRAATRRSTSARGTSAVRAAPASSASARW
jgi:L-ascorbate metabolism protein UlaG (beta-lactamase superfamily)